MSEYADCVSINGMYPPEEPITYTMRETKRPWWKRARIHIPGCDVLTAFSVILVVLHAVIESKGGVENYEALYTQQLGVSVEGIRSGKVWQCFTYGLLHASWLHLLANLFMIWIIGGRLLVIIGQKKLLVTMLLSCLGGGVLFVLLDIVSGVNRPLVGASGIAYGLFILMAMLAPTAKMFPLPVSARNMAIGTLIASALLCIMNPNLGVPLFKNAGLWLENIQLANIFRIAHSCHLGGGLVGLYMSSKVMGKVLTLEELRKQRID